MNRLGGTIARSSLRGVSVRARSAASLVAVRSLHLVAASSSTASLRVTPQFCPSLPQHRVLGNTIFARSFSSFPAHTKLNFPALSPTMTKGILVSWAKKEGDAINPGDMLGEIETDKSVMAFEASEEGYLAKILVPAGTPNIPVGTEIAIIVENKEDLGKFKDYTPEAAPKAAAPAAPAPKAAAPAPTPTPAPAPAAPAPAAPSQPAPQQPAGGRVFASPLARATAAASGVELSGVAGTGPGGRIIKADVLEAASRPAAAQPAFAAPIPPAVTASFTDIPNSNIRKVIASRLTASKQTIPHYYLTIEANVDALLKIRTDLNAKANGAYKLSVNDFVVKAAAVALRKVPEVNSSWAEEAIRRYHTVDINVAVNTDAGLFTPLIANADQKGLATIANSVKELAEKAKNSKLTPNDLTIGTFTISNLGMFGIKHFSAVINPPQACILAVGGTEKKVIVKGNNDKGEPVFGVANVMNLTLSCDHRVVDGAVGARWLQAFKEVLEDPIKLLL